MMDESIVLPPELVDPVVRQSVRRVLIHHGMGLGDAVIAEPAVRAIQKAYPAARIDVMLPERNRSLVRLGYPGDGFPSYAEFADGDAPFASYDVVFDGLPLNTSDRAFYRRLPSGAHILYPFGYRPPEYRGIAALDRWRLGLEVAGIPMAADVLPSISVPARARVAATAWLSRRKLDPLNRMIIALQPGSGWMHKRWKPERFAAALNTMVSRHNAAVLLITGAGEQGMQDAVAGLLPPEHLFPVTQKPLALVAALIARSFLFLGNDSGVSHVAAAVGTPVTVVFGPTNRHIWTPNNRCAVVRGNYRCCPSQPSECGTPCLDSVAPARVVAAMEALITEVYQRTMFPSLNGIAITKNLNVAPLKQGIRIWNSEIGDAIEIREGGAFIFRVLKHIERYGQVDRLLGDLPEVAPLLGTLFGRGIVEPRPGR